jgi:hypothetical protein
MDDTFEEEPMVVDSAEQTIESDLQQNPMNTDPMDGPSTGKKM